MLTNIILTYFSALVKLLAKKLYFFSKKTDISIKQYVGMALGALYKEIFVSLQKTGILSGNKNFIPVLHNIPEMPAVKLRHSQNFFQLK